MLKITNVIRPVILNARVLDALNRQSTPEEKAKTKQTTAELGEHYKDALLAVVLTSGPDVAVGFGMALSFIEEALQAQASVEATSLAN